LIKEIRLLITVWQPLRKSFIIVLYSFMYGASQLIFVSGITTQNQADAKQMSDNLAAGVTCYTTDCNVACQTGTNEVTQMDGQPNQLSTNGRCSAGQHRSLW
jgi:hypothetical protein